MAEADPDTIEITDIIAGGSAHGGSHLYVDVDNNDGRDLRLEIPYESAGEFIVRLATFHTACHKARARRGLPVVDEMTADACRVESDAAHTRLILRLRYRTGKLTSEWPIGLGPETSRQLAAQQLQLADEIDPARRDIEAVNGSAAGRPLTRQV
jgi:hypothetical protein